MSAEPVVPPRAFSESEAALLDLVAKYGHASFTEGRRFDGAALSGPPQDERSGDLWRAILEALRAAVARPALPAPPDLQAKAWKKLTEEYEMVVMALDRGDFDWQKERKDVLHQLSTALKMWRLGAALPAPEPPPGPWRVAQNAGATPQPRYVELWEPPDLERYGQVWKSNGFPSAEEAQAVCDALNRLERK